MYHIRIGEAITTTGEDSMDGVKFIRDFVEIRPEQHVDAPDIANDEYCKVNERSMSGTRWEAFCRESSLERLFGREGTPLFQNWSGLSAVQFTADAVDRVHKALEKYRTAHPAAVPGFTDGEWPPSDGVTDPILARLVWLDYWMSWAVQKCEKPSIQFG